jgi:hypothetical protein
VTAGNGSCSSKGATAAGGSCSAHGVGVTSANSSGPCNGQGVMMGVNGDMNENCDACAGMQTCRAELDAMGATVQVVPLKNGVMYVYTADTPAHIRSVQATLAHRDARVTALLAEGDKAKLCPDCKNMRGAIASGKMTRELVRVESGCLMMLTSSDPTMVLKLHDLSGVKTMARAKL